MDLVTFLRARLDEDEQAAGLVTAIVYACDGHSARGDCIAQTWEKWADGEDRLPNHHANWTPIYDPARVLREVAAKRELIEQHVAYYGDGHDRSWPVQVLSTLASVYSEHPDYDEAWRPDADPDA